MNNLHLFILNEYQVFIVDLQHTLFVESDFLIKYPVVKNLFKFSNNETEECPQALL